MAANLIKLFSCVAMVLCMVHQSEAKPSAIKYLRLKCNYKCMTDFDMCSSLCTSMEMYIMCFRGQGMCRRQCKSKYGITRSPRQLFTTESTLVPDGIRQFRVKLDALRKKKEQW